MRLALSILTCAALFQAPAWSSEARPVPAPVDAHVRTAMAQAVALREAQARESGQATDAAAGSSGRGAFGQRAEGAPAPAAAQNRAQRRAEDRKKG